MYFCFCKFEPKKTLAGSVEIRGEPKCCSFWKKLNGAKKTAVAKLVLVAKVWGRCDAYQWFEPLLGVGRHPSNQPFEGSDLPLDGTSLLYY